MEVRRSTDKGSASNSSRFLGPVRPDVASKQSRRSSLPSETRERQPVQVDAGIVAADQRGDGGAH